MSIESALEFSGDAALKRTQSVVNVDGHGALKEVSEGDNEWNFLRSAKSAGLEQRSKKKMSAASLLADYAFPMPEVEKESHDEQSDYGGDTVTTAQDTTDDEQESIRQQAGNNLKVQITGMPSEAQHKYEIFPTRTCGSESTEEEEGDNSLRNISVLDVAGISATFSDDNEGDGDVDACAGEGAEGMEPSRIAPIIASASIFSSSPTNRLLERMADQTLLFQRLARARSGEASEDNFWRIHPSLPEVPCMSPRGHFWSGLGGMPSTFGADWEDDSRSPNADDGRGAAGGDCIRLYLESAERLERRKREKADEGEDGQEEGSGSYLSWFAEQLARCSGSVW